MTLRRKLIYLHTAFAGCDARNQLRAVFFHQPRTCAAFAAGETLHQHSFGFVD